MARELFTLGSSGKIERALTDYDVESLSCSIRARFCDELCVLTCVRILAMYLGVNTFDVNPLVPEATYCHEQRCSWIRGISGPVKYIADLQVYQVNINDLRRNIDLQS